MTKSIIFDLDGTLWDSRETITKAWNNIFKKNNINLTITKEELNNLLGLTPNEIQNKYFNNINNILKQCEQEEIETIKQIGGNLYPNTIETLKELNKTHNLYIVSNCQKGYIEAFLNYYNINNLFKDYECSGNNNLNKEQNIKLIIERNNITNPIYIGDTNNDLLSSKNNNIDFIYANYGFGNINYPISINNIKELIDIIKENS